ncbi:hypothetical protein KAFR_0C04980 [Kazachstania africana CBS 2517]|uniref:Zn(2)-C6 fungal-type domain-containing protein n=1 Tax=Kazachstania africana (strain ATCC 22294 / BCRC 22015 / CBS 2517 / CECT 1963 / NBRC 1671 / NRRL Y-8276) TaxID=1071382 RepID=H2ASY9_KAZAF|nr:hypothetical protein KAFR_0C04980 [Kazachstania africana CBS 2517]CCF57489.1 hypothetical protein KAFR_0C04980 [Kazachstania africana CBS 2517]
MHEATHIKEPASIRFDTIRYSTDAKLVMSSSPDNIVRAGSVNDSQEWFGKAGKVVKKRNRISFVCQACRKAKTKCDKEKPMCSRCRKQDLECVYDIELQRPPKNPNKDSAITRLENDIQYWKKRTQALIRDQEIEMLKKPKEESTPTTKEIQEDEKSWQNLKVNIYRDNPRLIISKVMKREVNPLSENYLIIKDNFLTSILLSVFSNYRPTDNSVVPALAADVSITKAQSWMQDNASKLTEVLAKQCRNEKQKSKLKEFTNRLLQIPSSNDNNRVKLISSILSNPKEYHNIEDHCTLPNEYSEILQEFIAEYEKILPPKFVMKSYKSHFYENIYPCLPFLNKEIFEESINSTLIGDLDDPNKLRINLGVASLRNKMENLSILLIILKISHMSLQFLQNESNSLSSRYFDDTMLTLYPIKVDAIMLAQRFLASENWCACPNENIITCLLYIWAFFVFSPEEAEFFLENPTDVISNLTVMLATTIGLHRDPLEYPQLVMSKDIRVLNHRRLLWLSVISMSSFESTIKGRRLSTSENLFESFINFHDPSTITEYMKRVRNDMSPPNFFTLKLHKFTFEVTYFVLLHQKLNELTMSYNGSFHLYEYEDLISKINAFADLEFSNSSQNIVFDQLEGIAEDKVGQLSLLSTRNSIVFFYGTMSKIMMLRSYMALMLHFENLCVKDSEQYLFYYYKYFSECLIAVLELSNILQKYYKGEKITGISPLTNYHASKTIQLSVSTILLTLLVILSRFELASYMLSNRSQFTRFIPENDIESKTRIINEIKKIFEIAITKIYNLASENLRFTYFSIFKILILSDIVMQKMKSGDLWNGMVSDTNMENKFSNSKINKIFTMTVDFNIDKNGKLIDHLKLKNHLIKFDIQKLREISERINTLILDYNNTLCGDIKPIELNETNVENMATNFLPEFNDIDFSDNIPDLFLDNLDFLDYDLFFSNK